MEFAQGRKLFLAKLTMRFKTGLLRPTGVNNKPVRFFILGGTLP